MYLKIRSLHRAAVLRLQHALKVDGRTRAREAPPLPTTDPDETIPNIIRPAHRRRFPGQTLEAQNTGVEICSHLSAVC